MLNHVLKYRHPFCCCCCCCSTFLKHSLNLFHSSFSSALPVPGYCYESSSNIPKHSSNFSSPPPPSLCQAIVTKVLQLSPNIHETSSSPPSSSLLLPPCARLLLQRFFNYLQTFIKPLPHLLLPPPPSLCQAIVTKVLQLSPNIHETSSSPPSSSLLLPPCARLLLQRFFNYLQTFIKPLPHLLLPPPPSLCQAIVTKVLQLSPNIHETSSSPPSSSLLLPPCARLLLQRFFNYLQTFMKPLPLLLPPPPSLCQAIVTKVLQLSPNIHETSSSPPPPSSLLLPPCARLLLRKFFKYPQTFIKLFLSSSSLLSPPCARQIDRAAGAVPSQLWTWRRLSPRKCQRCCPRRAPECPGTRTAQTQAR